MAGPSFARGVVGEEVAEEDVTLVVGAGLVDADVMGAGVVVDEDVGASALSVILK